MIENAALKALVELHGRLSRNLISEDKRIRNDETLTEEEKTVERDRLWEKWEESGRNLVNARNLVFNLGDAVVGALMADLADAQADLETALITHRKTVDVLRAITRAVEIAGRLVALGRGG